MSKSYWLALLLALPMAGLAQPPAGAQQAFQKVCGACHSLETVTSQRRTRPQWQESITSMIARGAKGTEEEFSLILDYLTVQYGPVSPAAADRRRQQRRRPADAGAERRSRPARPISTWSTRQPPIAADGSMRPSASPVTGRTRAAAIKART